MESISAHVRYLLWCSAIQGIENMQKHFLLIDDIKEIAVSFL